MKCLEHQNEILIVQKFFIFERGRRKISQKTYGFLEHQKPPVFESYDFSGHKIEADKNFVFVASKLKILTDFAGFFDQSAQKIK